MSAKTDQAVIYHNPRCGKSRETLALLQQHGLDIVEVHYLRDPPTVAALDGICRKLGVEPVAIMRTGEARFKELGLSKNDRRDRKAWLKILHDNPVLIERPIVVYKDKAVLGRPPQNVSVLWDE